jgi:serine/threonine-protein kinase ATR
MEDPIAKSASCMSKYPALHLELTPCARQSFLTLAQDAQCQMLEDMGFAACANARTLTTAKICSACDCKTPGSSSKVPLDDTLYQTLFQALTDISHHVHEQKTPRPRVTTMLAVTRLLVHSDIGNHLDLRETALGQWCCQSLKSSIRDLRIATVNVLEPYLRLSIRREILQQNRLTCLEYIRSMSDRNDWSLQETCIMGLGQVGRLTMEENERNIVLLRLVEYLGHTSPFISSMAYLASLESGNTRQLFDPYWSTIAVLVVKNLQTRPQIAEAICDLLGIHVSELLQRTQFYTIPYLVYKGQIDILQRIAKANGSEETTHSLCYQHGQLAAILTFLLLQPNDDAERFVTESMARVSERFAALTMADLMKCDTMYMAFELLKIAGDPDSPSNFRAGQVIQYLAEVVHHLAKNQKITEKWKDEARGAFFDTWALAIVQLLSEIITEAKGPQPVFERRRCIFALTKMARLATYRLSNALPQVSSPSQPRIILT